MNLRITVEVTDAMIKMIEALVVRHSRVSDEDYATPCYGVRGLIPPDFISMALAAVVEEKTDEMLGEDWSQFFMCLKPSALLDVKKACDNLVDAIDGMEIETVQ